MSGLPKAFKAATKFRYGHNNKMFNYVRYFAYTYLWGGREYGLQFHDLMFENAPEVKEALRRLSLKEPHVYDQRMKRLFDAHVLRENFDKKPRDEWTQWDQETFYLQDYIAEVEREKASKKATSSVAPSFKHHENTDFKN